MMRVICPVKWEDYAMYAPVRIAKLPRIDNVELKGLVPDSETSPNLRITVSGRVFTSGWTNPELGAWIYLDKPADGILRFDFIAAPPPSYSGPLATPIAASVDILVPEWAKGVEVYSASGSVVELFETFPIPHGDGPPTPWPWPWSLGRNTG